MPDDQTNEDFLAIVSAWTSYSHGGGLLGTAYPILSMTQSTVVRDPYELFPNPGRVFLLARGQVEEWDFICVRPQLNRRFSGDNHSECRYLYRGEPEVMEVASDTDGFAVLLEVPDFNPAANHIDAPAHNVTPLFFVRDKENKVFGPLVRTQVVRSQYAGLKSISWRCFVDSGILFELGTDDFKKHGVNEVQYNHPASQLDPVVRTPISLLVGPVASLRSSALHDTLTNEQLVDWYLRWSELRSSPVSQFTRVFKNSVDALKDTSQEYITRRCDRIGTLLPSLEALQGEGQRIAKEFLSTEIGEVRLAQEISREVERRAAEVQAEVKQREAELAQLEERLKTEYAETERKYTDKKSKLVDECDRLSKQHLNMEEGLVALQKELAETADGFASNVKEHIPLLAAIMSGLTAGTSAVAEESATSACYEPVSWTHVEQLRPTRPTSRISDESALVTQIVTDLWSRGLRFTKDFVANVYVTMKSNQLNLIAGPPGHGKSALIAVMAEALGHGDSLLEIPVRRSWSDDRYLLGFYDAFHCRYDPGQTGLVPRLLQAQRDWDDAGTNIVIVLLDEFNLAAPEYYFSQIMQSISGSHADSLIRLHQSLPSMAQNDELAAIKITPNVRFWGTINYDETTERLSPRLLDRTGMIFLTQRDVSPSFPPDTHGSLQGRNAVAAIDLFQDHSCSAADCPEDAWAVFEELLGLLRSRKSDDLGSGIAISPRVQDGIKRYLANSHGILSQQRAVDFAFEQRVLPLVRGRGTKFDARISALLEMLEDTNCERSAAHIRSSLEIAEANFGEIDFFAY